MTWKKDDFKLKEGEPRKEIIFDKVSAADIRRMEDERIVEECVAAVLGIEGVKWESVGKNTAEDLDMDIIQDIERKLSGEDNECTVQKGEHKPGSKTDMEDSE